MGCFILDLFFILESRELRMRLGHAFLVLGMGEVGVVEKNIVRRRAVKRARFPHSSGMFLQCRGTEVLPSFALLPTGFQVK